MMIPLGLVVVLAIVVPWYAALYHRYGWTYITSFIVGENIARYTEGLGVEQRRGLLVLPAGRVQRFLPVVAVPVRCGRRSGSWTGVTLRSTESALTAIAAFGSGRSCGCGSSSS